MLSTPCLSSTRKDTSRYIVYSKHCGGNLPVHALSTHRQTSMKKKNKQYIPTSSINTSNTYLPNLFDITGGCISWAHTQGCYNTPIPCNMSGTTGRKIVRRPLQTDPNHGCKSTIWPLTDHNAHNHAWTFCGDCKATHCVRAINVMHQLPGLGYGVHGFNCGFTCRGL